MGEAAAGPRRAWVLFDIDCTLLRSDGAGRAALQIALERVFGTAGDLDGYRVHGKTDPQIVVDLLGAAGWDAAEVRRRLPSLWPVYLEALEGTLRVRRDEGRITVLPGVPDLLAALEAARGVSLGLLTGNIEPAAKLKLAAAGVTTRFEVGGFGSDSEDRAEIARLAVDRCRASIGSASPAAVVIVGDTPDDVACARAVGGRAVAVATGVHGEQELAGAGADAVFADFRETAEVVRCILAMAETAGSSSAASGSDRDR